MKKTIPNYCVCSHCGAQYAPKTPSEKKHRNEPYRLRYCSDACKLAAAQLRLKPLATLVCERCGKSYEVKSFAAKNRQFCGMDCYVKSDKFRAMQEKNMEAGRVAAKKRATEAIPPSAQCKECGETFIPKSRKRKFCSVPCYRRYMAKRFDRWISSPGTFAQVQNFDGFFTENEHLHCIVDGCNWEGKHLGNHLNFHHGIQAGDAKRAAGFNLGTGLVCLSTHESLCDRPHIGVATFGGKRRVKGSPPLGDGVVRYLSRERIEHGHKARELMRGNHPKSCTCQGCGVEFVYNEVGQKLYCSPKCRNDVYAKEDAALVHEMVCAFCGKAFLGNANQRRRVLKGSPVTCTVFCKGKLNSHKRKDWKGIR